MNGLATSQQALGVGHLCHRRSCAKLCVTDNSSGRQQRVHLADFGPAACGRLTTLWASARDSHRVHVAVQQRTHSIGEVPHPGHSPTHLAAAPASTDDSLKIIMLLSLSLTLMLLPWMSRHPEFLIAPALLAVTPVVGNGVRPLLKEVITSLLSTLRLSFGVLTHHDEQQFASHHAHDSHHHHGNNHYHQHNGRQQHMQQQHQQSHHQQQPLPQGPYSSLPQQATPIGPYSPWPNPAQVPARWPPASARSPARSPAASTGSADVDGDWTPSTSPDLHHMDRHSHQHLQEVLAADQQTDRELGHPPSAAALSSRSPAGSPGSSLSSIDMPHHAEHAAGGGHRHQHHHHGRDPRMLSKEAKQQLYNGHHQQQQQ